MMGILVVKGLIDKLTHFSHIYTPKNAKKPKVVFFFWIFVKDTHREKAPLNKLPQKVPQINSL